MSKSKNPAADRPVEKLTLEWRAGGDHVALLFGPKLWMAFESAAQAKGMTAQDMITRAVVYTLGTVVFDGTNSETGNA
jgi:hypothetical protein